MPDDDNDTSKNNNELSQGITHTGPNDVTPKMAISEIESSKGGGN